MTLAVEPAVSDIDPFSDAYFADPYIANRRIRDAGRAVRLERYSIWAMAQYDDVAKSLNDWKTFMSGAGVGIQDFRKQKPWRPQSLVLETDPPLHDQTRGALSRIMSGPAVKRLREAFKLEADRLVNELVERGEFDAVSDFAIVYPLKVMGDAVGVAPEGRECLLPFSNMLFNSFGPENKIFSDSIADAQRVLPQLFAQCERSALSAGSFGAQIFEAADAGLITQEQAPALVRSILSAGFDTTVNGLSNALYAFATNPEQWEKVRASPTLQRSSFDEVIRWETPVQIFCRTANTDVEIGEARIQRDEKVLLLLASANRDPRRWTDPDSFNVERNTAGHVAFGSGIHVCVGQMIAKMEAELLFAAFARRVIGFELAGDFTRRRSNSLRGFARLPIRLRLS